MHREFHEFNGVHVYLRRNPISLLLYGPVYTLSRKSEFTDSSLVFSHQAKMKYFQTSIKMSVEATSVFRMAAPAANPNVMAFQLSIA